MPNINEILMVEVLCTGEPEDMVDGFIWQSNSILSYCQEDHFTTGVNSLARACMQEVCTSRLPGAGPISADHHMDHVSIGMGLFNNNTNKCELEFINIRVYRKHV